MARDRDAETLNLILTILQAKGNIPAIARQLKITPKAVRYRISRNPDLVYAFYSHNAPAFVQQIKNLVALNHKPLEISTALGSSILVTRTLVAYIKENANANS